MGIGYCNASGSPKGDFAAQASSPCSLSGRDNCAELNLATGSDGNQACRVRSWLFAGLGSRLLTCAFA